MQRTSIAKKAVLYAKAAAMLAAGAWIAFTPLASPAQGLQAPQQKSIRARPPASQASRKATSYPDAAGAQQKRGSAQATEKQPQGQEKYDSTHPYAGVRRILVELAAQPDSAQFYSRKYAVLIDEIAAALQDSLGSAPVENRRLLAVLWRIMQSRFSFADDTKFMSNSLMANAWDCDNSSTVAYDVLRKLGFSPEAIILSGHVLLQNQWLDFETRTGEIYSHDSIGFHYSSPVDATPGIGALMVSAYLELGNRDADSSRFESAIWNYQIAISINPGDPNPHNNLGRAYECLGKYGDALREYSIAISLAPHCLALLNRATLYEKLGRGADAQADREAYYGVKGIKILNY